MELVKLAEQEVLSSSRELCRRFRVSAPTAYKWMARLAARLGPLASTASPAAAQQRGTQAASAGIASQVSGVGSTQAAQAVE